MFPSFIHCTLCNMGIEIYFVSSLVKKSASRKRLTFKLLYISLQSTKMLIYIIKGSLMVYVNYCLVKSQILVACAIAKNCNKKQPSLAAYIYRLKGGLWRKFLDVYVNTMNRRRVQRHNSEQYFLNNIK